MSEEEANPVWDLFCAVVKQSIVGFLMSGLFLGALYFAAWLIRLCRLDKRSRQYVQMGEHLLPETLLRYRLTIALILLLDGLIYWHFPAMRNPAHIGLLFWGGFLLVKKWLPAKKFVRVVEDRRKNE